MKKIDVIVNAIIIPLVLGIIFGVAFLFYFKGNAQDLLPVSAGTELAYHDEYSSDNTLTDKTDFDSLVSNDNVGTLTSGSVSLSIKYDADYSNMLNSVSIKEGSDSFGEIGCTYLNVYMSNIQDIDFDDTLTVQTVFGDYKYQFVEKQIADSEYEILTNNPDVKSGLVIYYQNSDGLGLSSKYSVLVFEEVT
jgi:hypothetical protein